MPTKVTPWKYVDSVLCLGARAAFNSIQFFNKYRPNPAFTPKWSDKPLLKSWEKSKPTLGWPRETDSLCPKCVIEAREKIVNGKEDYQILINEKVGEIKAQIIERDGEVWMVKECPRHGKFEDIMAVDSKFLSWIESNFPGRDIQAHNDEDLHNHGSSTIKHGRGSVLTVDLTNRCNMMCDPCFMDANQVGFVHELEWAEIKEILDNSLKIKPRRQMSVQFSGGEPTVSPHFFRAIKYARKIGFNSVQCATNGIEFAQSKDFSRKAAEAGLRYVYFQFDGIGNDANSHRHIGNLFDVKLRAINNIHEAGIEIVLVITLVNDVNNDQVGPIIRFAMDNPKKIAFIAFQPVSFTGRDEEITDERRLRQRYTLSHLARDVKDQTGLTEPLEDWFPLSLMGAFADFADMAHGPTANWGQVSCGCHPNCGVGTAMMIDKETKEAAPVSQFLNIPGLVADMQKVTDAARGTRFSNLMMGLALLKNYRPFRGPSRLTLMDIMKKFDKSFGLTGRDYGTNSDDRRDDPWNFLFIAGMWFQDLFNYDFRRTEMCIIPYGTQEGEISFCAYNTGHGWRNIIEHMYKNATVADWYKEHGRHEIFAGGKDVNLENYDHSLSINAEDSSRIKERNDKPQTARDEKLARRKAAKEAVMVREYYEEMVLNKKKEKSDLVELTIN
ncbi:MAG: radical SAM protein [Acidobacteriota bacterium]